MPAYVARRLTVIGAFFICSVVLNESSGTTAVSEAATLNSPKLNKVTLSPAQPIDHFALSFVKTTGIDKASGWAALAACY